MTINELRAMSKEDFLDLYELVQQENERRQTLIKTELMTDSLNRQYMQARDGIADPDNPPAWVQPTGAHDAYPMGYLVTHGGKTWESLTPGNVWTPGESGWREQTAEGEVAAWVQPTGAHDAYPMGATVTHNGHTWESQHEANVWEPPTLWTDLGTVEA